MSDTDELQQLKRYIVQTVAHMTAKGIKTGIFEDWTAANEIYDKVEGYITQYGDKRELDGRIDELGKTDGLFDCFAGGEKKPVMLRLAELKKQREEV